MSEVWVWICTALAYAAVKPVCTLTFCPGKGSAHFSSTVTVSELSTAFSLKHFLSGPTSMPFGISCKTPSTAGPLSYLRHRGTSGGLACGRTTSFSGTTPPLINHLPLQSMKVTEMLVKPPSIAPWVTFRHDRKFFYAPWGILALMKLFLNSLNFWPWGLLGDDIL